MNKTYNVIINSITSYNKSKIKYENVMIKVVVGKKYFGYDYKAGAVVFLIKGAK